MAYTRRLRENVAAQLATWAKLKERLSDHELQNQIDPRDTHGIGDVGAYVCGSKRRCAAGRAIGSVSVDRWSVGDLRFALCETEIEAVTRLTAWARGSLLTCA